MEEDAAVGTEYRSDAVKGATDPFSAARQFFMGGGSIISGKIEVIEGYAEAEVPILANQTFFDELSVNGAVRRTHYSRSSDLHPSSSLNVTTWKIGGVWHELKSGDSIYFSSALPHRWCNRARTVTEAIWVSSPPSF